MKKADVFYYFVLNFALFGSMDILNSTSITSSHPVVSALAVCVVAGVMGWILALLAKSTGNLFSEVLRFWRLRRAARRIQERQP